VVRAHGRLINATPALQMKMVKSRQRSREANESL